MISLLGVKDTLLLVDLGPDGDGRVDGVGNDTNVSVGAVLGTSESQISDDGSVGVLLLVPTFSHIHSRHTKRSSRLKQVSVGPKFDIKILTSYRASWGHQRG
jgi:hypothetical protein